MSYVPAPTIRQRFFDDVTGAPLAGGQLFTYEAGTTTPQDTFSNSTGTLNTNPVVLDANGYADVWVDPALSYKFVLEDSLGNTLWTEDNVTTPIEVNAWNADTVYSQGEIVQDLSGVGQFYVSITNNNLGNALTSVSNWRRLGGNIRTVSTNTSLVITDELVRSNSTSGNLVHTLPACSTTPVGTAITIIDVGTGGYTTSAKGSGSDLIGGNNTYAYALGAISSQSFENNGTSWDPFPGVAPNASIGTAQIINLAVTAAQIANATITRTQVANNINLPGSAVQENGSNVVVSNTNATKSLAIIRGFFDGTNNPGSGTSYGEGWTASYGSSVTTITFTTPFGSAPVVLANMTGEQEVAVTINSAQASECSIYTNGSNSAFHFIAIGPRA